MKTGSTFRSYLDTLIAKHPELFPAGISGGYWLHDTLHSKKLDLTMRRIKLVTTQAVYQVRPDFALPYMVGLTDEVEKALYLRRFGVPFEALTYVFGREPSYWYRLYQSLGRLSIVGTTVKASDSIPVNLLADEKHSWLLGERVFIPTTVGSGCFPGGGYRSDCRDSGPGARLWRLSGGSAGPESRLSAGNREYRWLGPHSSRLETAFSPELRSSFVSSTASLIFRSGAARPKTSGKKLTGRLWHVYKAPSKRHFAQRLRRLRDWAQRHVKQRSVLQRLLNLKGKSPQFQVAYDYPDAARTSNMLDRLMNHQDRLLYAMQYFHGSEASARLYLRAMALLWNFHPYGRRTTTTTPGRRSPFKDLNGFQYHENWLRNLLIAGSMNGHRV